MKWTVRSNSFQSFPWKFHIDNINWKYFYLFNSKAVSDRWKLIKLFFDTLHFPLWNYQSNETNRNDEDKFLHFPHKDLKDHIRILMIPRQSHILSSILKVLVIVKNWSSCFLIFAVYASRCFFQIQNRLKTQIHLPTILKFVIYIRKSFLIFISVIIKSWSRYFSIFCITLSKISFFYWSCKIRPFECRF